MNNGCYERMLFEQVGVGLYLTRVPTLITLPGFQPQSTYPMRILSASVKAHSHKELIEQPLFGIWANVRPIFLLK